MRLSEDEAVPLAGVTWISSLGIIAKMLRNLGRLGNRETPTIPSILVIEDLAMAVAVASLILFLALRHGRIVSALFSPHHGESLVLGVRGLTVLVAGIAQPVTVSAVVGAFLVDIAISGQVTHSAERVLTPPRDFFADIFFVFFGIATDPADIVPDARAGRRPRVAPDGDQDRFGVLSRTRRGYRSAGSLPHGIPEIHPRVSASLGSPPSTLRPRLSAVGLRARARARARGRTAGTIR